MIVPLILAGGIGSRLKPISTSERPKPFHDFIGDGKTLFEATVIRAQQVSPVTPIVVVSKHHLNWVRASLEKLSITAHILLEPCGRNTAPAITCAALMARELYGEAPALLTLAADHHIGEIDYFARKICEAHSKEQNKKLTLFGVQPTYPETGYGYIQTDESNHVVAFHEKPDPSTAQCYLDSGDYLWNSGFFLFPISTLLHELQHHAPELMKVCIASYTARQSISMHIQMLANSFQDAANISIDHALLERSKNLTICRYQGIWSDLGTWKSLYHLWPKESNGNAINNALNLEIIPCDKSFKLLKNGSFIADVQG